MPVTGDTPDPNCVVSLSTIRPDLGGGSPGSESGSVPSETAITTPPEPPLGEVDQSSGKLIMVNASTNTFPNKYFCFSAKTCLELLPMLSDEQLEHEFNYFNLMGCDINVRAKAAKYKGVSIARELSHVLLKQSNDDFTKSLQKLNTLTSTVSHVVESLTNSVNTARADVARHEADPVSPVTGTQQSSDNAFLTSTTSSADSLLSTDLNINTSDSEDLPHTVCSFNSNITFGDISIDDVKNQITFDRTHHGGRETTYFGPTPYTYGNVTHTARPFPECDVFSKLFERLSSQYPSVTPDNFSCLVTYYNDGSVGIPAHSDNEEQIVPGSSILTVSIGATRKLRFMNSIGRIKERDVEVINGSLYSISVESQREWTHCLLPDRQVSGPRISFTFRQLIASPPQNFSQSNVEAQSSSIPPINPPEPVKPRIAQGTHRRILFLTDSVLKRTPPHIFNRIGGNNQYRCVTKMNYELSNIFNYDAEFKYTDIVLISCGVNDLARYGKRPEVLADLIVRRLRECCATNKHTTFVFNSILHTSHDWLNDAIDNFNRIIFDVSLKVSNLTFFDSHSVLLNSSISGPRSQHNVGVLAKDDDGIHITFEARRLVTDQLVNGLHMLACGREGRHVTDRVHGWNWPLRREYWDTISFNSVKTIKR